jgi:hypothetical protein
MSAESRRVRTSRRFSEGWSRRYFKNGKELVQPPEFRGVHFFLKNTYPLLRKIAASSMPEQISSDKRILLRSVQRQLGVKRFVAIGSDIDSWLGLSGSDGWDRKGGGNSEAFVLAYTSQYDPQRTTEVDVEYERNDSVETFFMAQRIKSPTREKEMVETSANEVELVSSVDGTEWTIRVKTGNDKRKQSSELFAEFSCVDEEKVTIQVRLIPESEVSGQIEIWSAAQIGELAAKRIIAGLGTQPGRAIDTVEDTGEYL